MAPAAGNRVQIGMQPVADIIAMPQAYIVEETRGMMKFVIGTETDDILGAALLSVDAQDRPLTPGHVRRNACFPDPVRK